MALAGVGRRLEISDEDRVELERIVRAASSEVRVVERARIVLCAAEGLTASGIAERVGCGEKTAKKWRGRYARAGIEGLRDAPRPGPPLTHGPEVRALLIAKACTRPPETPGARQERWTYEQLGAAVGMAVEGRDTHFEGVCAHLREAIREERDRGDPVAAWRTWLAQRGHPDVDVHETPDGALRVVLPARAFVGDGAFRLYQLGSFETWQRAFLQLWCAAAPLRRAAVLDRVLTMVWAHTIKTHAQLDVRLDQHATLLEVPPPATADLRDYARQCGDIDAVAVIDALER